MPAWMKDVLPNPDSEYSTLLLYCSIIWENLLISESLPLKCSESAEVYAAKSFQGLPLSFPEKS